MGRLKGIPTILSPDLLHVLAAMGHGDEIVLADANFPAASVCGAGPRQVRADGHNVPEMLRAVLTLMPLDHYDPPAVMVMQVEPRDQNRGLKTPIWDTFREIVLEAEGPLQLGTIPRFDFYERAKKAYAVVQTGETALYGNIILKKGIVE